MSRPTDHIQLVDNLTKSMITTHMGGVEAFMHCVAFVEELLEIETDHSVYIQLVEPQEIDEYSNGSLTIEWPQILCIKLNYALTLLDQGEAAIHLYDTLIHELIHLWQIARGSLRVDSRPEGGVWWNEELWERVALENWGQCDLPWEKEAYSMSGPILTEWLWENDEVREQLIDGEAFSKFINERISDGHWRTHPVLVDEGVRVAADHGYVMSDGRWHYDFHSDRYVRINSSTTHTDTDRAIMGDRSYKLFSNQAARLGTNFSNPKAGGQTTGQNYSGPLRTGSGLLVPDPKRSVAISSV